MNWKAEMIKRVLSDVKGWIQVGYTREEAISKTQENCVAGPAVWAEVLKQI